MSHLGPGRLAMLSTAAVLLFVFAGPAAASRTSSTQGSVDLAASSQTGVARAEKAPSPTATSSAQDRSEPEPGGTPHWVRRGETLYGISKIYGVPADAICRANGIKNPGRLKAGTVLTIPNSPGAARTGGSASAQAALLPLAPASTPAAAAGRGRKRAPAPTAVPARAQSPPHDTPSTAAAAASADTRAPLRTRATPGSLTSPKGHTDTAISGPDSPFVPALPSGDKEGAAPEERASTAPHFEAWLEDEDEGDDVAPSGTSLTMVPLATPFLWPVEGGSIHSPFGKRGRHFHAGLDITAPWGSPVYAAREGTVVYSDRKLRGYGNVVIVDHGDGFSTLYAHNSRNLVRAGDTVTQGELIARVGATGNATGSHCHFEIRQQNVALDPSRYLAAADSVLTASGKRLAPDRPTQIHKAGILPIP